MSSFTSRRNRIVSDSGFIVEITDGRGGLRYSEGARSVDVDSEFLAEKGVAIYPDSIRSWTDSTGTTPVPTPEVERITRNIVAAFAFDGYSAEVIWARPGESG